MLVPLDHCEHHLTTVSTTRLVRINASLATSASLTLIHHASHTRLAFHASGLSFPSLANPTHLRGPGSDRREMIVCR